MDVTLESAASAPLSSTPDAASCAKTTEDATPQELSVAIVQKSAPAHPAHPGISVDELGDLPSLGSVKHATAECQPCSFFRRSKCTSGKACLYCHLEHEKDKRPGRRQRERIKAKEVARKKAEDGEDGTCGVDGTLAQVQGEKRPATDAIVDGAPPAKKAKGPSGNVRRRRKKEKLRQLAAGDKANDSEGSYSSSNSGPATPRSPLCYQCGSSIATRLGCTSCYVCRRPHMY